MSWVLFSTCLNAYLLVFNSFTSAGHPRLPRTVSERNPLDVSPNILSNAPNLHGPAMITQGARRHSRNDMWTGGVVSPMPGAGLFWSLGRSPVSDPETALALMGSRGKRHGRIRPRAEIHIQLTSFGAFAARGHFRLRKAVCGCSKFSNRRTRLRVKRTPICRPSLEHVGSASSIVAV